MSNVDKLPVEESLADEWDLDDLIELDEKITLIFTQEFDKEIWIEKGEDWLLFQTDGEDIKHDSSLNIDDIEWLFSEES